LLCLYFIDELSTWEQFPLKLSPLIRQTDANINHTMVEAFPIVKESMQQFGVSRLSDSTNENRLQLLEFLASEVLASRCYHVKYSQSEKLKKLSTDSIHKRVHDLWLLHPDSWSFLSTSNSVDGLKKLNNEISKAIINSSTTFLKPLLFSLQLDKVLESKIKELYQLNLTFTEIYRKRRQNMLEHFKLTVDSLLRPFDGVKLAFNIKIIQCKVAKFLEKEALYTGVTLFELENARDFIIPNRLAIFVKTDQNIPSVVKEKITEDLQPSNNIQAKFKTKKKKKIKKNTENSTGEDENKEETADISFKDLKKQKQQKKLEEKKLKREKRKENKLQKQHQHQHSEKEQEEEETKEDPDSEEDEEEVDE